MNERTNERTRRRLSVDPRCFPLSLSLSLFLSPRPRVRDAPFLSKGFEKKKKKKKKKNGEEWVFFSKKVVFFSKNLNEKICLQIKGGSFDFEIKTKRALLFVRSFVRSFVLPARRAF